MSITREELLKSAFVLSESDRLLLATDLLKTVSESPPGWSLESPELVIELESRGQDGLPGIPWESVRSRLRAELDA